MTLARSGLVAMALIFCPAILHAAAVNPPARITANGKLVFCTEMAFAPWDWINPATQKPEGFDVDIAAAVAKIFGVESEHRNIAFDGLIPALKANQCDAIISVLYDKPERRKVVDFVHYAKTGTSIIVNERAAVAVKELADLAGQKVAVGVGTAGETILNDFNKKQLAAGKDQIVMITLPGAADAIQQVNAGLAVAYIGSTDQAAYYNKQKPGTLKVVGAPLVGFPLGIATRQNDRELHDAIAAAMRQIHADGTYDQLVAKYGFEELAVPAD